MTLARTTEFDAFGPWVLEVASPDDLPRLFRDVDLSGARLAVKVPRAIERRYASPSMDLYDYLVVAGDQSVTILSRAGDRYSTSVLDYDAVVLIEVSVNLLDGRLRLLAGDGAEFVLPFNGVSEALMMRLVDVLRSRVPASSRRANFVVESAPARTDLGAQDVWLTGQFRELTRSQPEVQYFGGYGRGRLVPKGGAVARALSVVRPAVLHGVIVGGRGDELQLLSRRQWLTRARGPVYSRARTVIRPSSVTSVATVPHPDFYDVNTVSIQLGSTTVEYPVRPGSQVERALLALVAG
jgi:hypothetical protein